MCSSDLTATSKRTPAVRRDRELDRAALSAVKQWRFQPALRDGTQVASTVMVPVQFELDPASSMASN